MSSITTHGTEVPHGDDHGHNHPAHLAHHFDTPEQQYTSGKLGMWVFLGTELLMFGGLFCAYAVYRHNHPEVFEYAHTYLNKWWGAVNTVVLLVSSFTMAWAVRCAQLGNKNGLCILLALTLLGGAGFMAIKTIEYKDKWGHQLFPGTINKFNRDYKGDARPDEHHGEEEAHDSGVGGKPVVGQEKIVTSPEATARHDGATETPQAPAPGAHAEVAAMGHAPGPAIPVQFHDPNAGSPDAALIKPKSGGPAGIAAAEQEKHAPHLTYADLAARDKVRVNAFFSIYFLMTGLHGAHVVIGMGLIAWVLIKGASGIFGPAYYTPVDLVGLYWHLVDLIWIFLFPLLYLIH